MNNLTHHIHRLSHNDSSTGGIPGQNTLVSIDTTITSKNIALKLANVSSNLAGLASLSLGCMGEVKVSDCLYKLFLAVATYFERPMCFSYPYSLNLVLLSTIIIRKCSAVNQTVGTEGWDIPCRLIVATTTSDG